MIKIYKRLLQEGKIAPHKTSQKEISNLFEIIERDLKDTTFPELSTDRRFATAYNACLQAAKVIMYCEAFEQKERGTMPLLLSLQDLPWEKNLKT